MSLSAGVYPLILLSLGIGILEFLLPGSGNSKPSATYRAVAGLCVLLAMLGPIVSGISLLHELGTDSADGLYERLRQSDILPPEDTTSDREQALADELATAGASAVETWVYTTLENTFGIPMRNATVTARITVDLNGGGAARLEQVYICLSGAAVLRNPHDIETWFSDALGCPITLSVA